MASHKAEAALFGRSSRDAALCLPPQAGKNLFIIYSTSRPAECKPVLLSFYDMFPVDNPTTNIV
jgi:hypothetical protein